MRSINNNYLESKKEQVKTWSRIVTLILASLPLIAELRKKEPELTERLFGEGLSLALSIYVTSYYTLSSIFWPEPLSWTNRLLLIPGSLLALAHLKEGGKRLLTNN